MYLPRRYDSVIKEHFAENRQMLFLSGPRQVGKTSTSRTAPSSLGRIHYFNADAPEVRRLFAAGAAEVARSAQLDTVTRRKPILVLDEIHKMPRWKNSLKGLFDTYGERAGILVTGSARLDIFRRGGDSLLGRFLPHRMHPFSVGELVRPNARADALILPPKKLDRASFEALTRFGGFPEPLTRAEERFARRWRRLRSERLLREDLRDLTRLQDIAQVEHLVNVVAERVGGTSPTAALATEVGASQDSIRRWLTTLKHLYVLFSVRPWTRNVARTLRKAPKYYLWDWSSIDDPGARAENMVAAALLKACHFWTDAGLGDFSLHYLRDKQKREVDLIVVRDRTPWFLVEVKQGSGARLSPSLAYFQRAVGAAHAFQVVMDVPYSPADPFKESRPVIVPAQTFLSQLV